MNMDPSQRSALLEPVENPNIELKRSKAPQWLRSLKALSYRILLQKWRSPFSTFFELLIPLIFGFLLVVLRFYGKDFFVVTKTKPASYLSDHSYDNCPFGYYGPYVGFTGTRIAKNITDTFGFGVEDVYCQRVFNISGPSVLSIALNGIDGFHNLFDLSLVFDLFREILPKSIFKLIDKWRHGFFPKFKSLSLAPSGSQRRLNRFHMVELMSLLAFSQYPIHVEGESKLCHEFQHYVLSLQGTFDRTTLTQLAKQSKSPTTAKELNAALFICREIQTEVGISITIDVQNRDELPSGPFPLQNKDVTYNYERAALFGRGGNDRFGPSQADMAMLINGFFQYRLKYGSRNLGVWSREEIEKTVAFWDKDRNITESFEDEVNFRPSTFGVNEALRVIPDEYSVIRDYRRSQVWNNYLYLLEGSPHQMLSLFCDVCLKSGTIYKHRPFPQCDDFEEFLKLTVSDDAAKRWHYIVESSAPSEPFGETPIPISMSPCTAYHLKGILPTLEDSQVNWSNLTKTILELFQNRTTTSNPFNILQALHPAMNQDDGTTLASFDQNKFINKIKRKSDAQMNTTSSKTLEIIDRINKEIPSLPNEKLGKFRNELLLPWIKNQNSVAKIQKLKNDLIPVYNPFLRILYKILLENLMMEWSMTVISPTLNAAEIPEIGEAAFPDYDGWWDRLGELVCKHGYSDFIVLLLFLFPFMSIVDVLVAEKQSKMKEMFQIFGVSDSIQYISVYSFFIGWLSILILIYIMMTQTVFFTIKIITHFIFLFSFILPLISFAIVHSSFFNKARTATHAASGVFMLLFFLYRFMGQPPAILSFWQRISLMIVLFPGPLVHGSRLIASYQSGGRDNTLLGLRLMMTTSYGGVTLFECCIINIINAFIYFCIGWYLNQVWPGEIGITKPWYFPVTSVMHYLQKSHPAESDKNDKSFEDPSRFEPVKLHGNPEPFLKARGLRKRFQSRESSLFSETEYFDAVKGVDLDIYPSEIYVLLGHNGAGKTTLINMMIGMIQSTSGTVSICGKDLNTQSLQARESLGYCPQHDILYDFMTVYEHLMMFGIMKGLSLNELKMDIEEILEVLKITGKKHSRASTLSGGQKRRLSLAIALIGRSKVLFLDEPSSGMDPFTRRALWDILQRIKIGRSIIFTTHSMEEADVLGTRIGIMAQGKMQCSGTALFLKRMMGVGYTLSISKSNQYTLAQESILNQMVLSSIPGSSLLSNISLEICFKIPFDATDSLPNFLMDLEDNNEKYGIQSFSMSLTTLEEVFLKVGCKIDEVTGLTDLEEANEREALMKRHSLANTAVFYATDERRTSEEEAFEKAMDVPVRNFQSKNQNEELNMENQQATLYVERTESMHDLFQDAFRRKSDDIHKPRKRSTGILFMKQFLALFLKRSKISLRNPVSLFWTLFEGPGAVLITLFVFQQASRQFLPKATNPIEYLSSYSSVKPASELFYGFDSKVGIGFRDTQIEIMKHCPSSVWEPIWLSEIESRESMDYYLRKRRYNNINEERQSNFFRPYTAIFFDADSTTSNPYPIFIHDSAFTYSLPTAFSFYTSCIANSINPQSTIVTKNDIIQAQQPEMSLSIRSFQYTHAKYDFIATILVSFLVVQFIAVLPGFAGNFPIQEVKSDAKRSQRIANVSVIAYWLTTWIWDCVLFLISSSLLLAIVYLYDAPIMSSSRIMLTIQSVVVFGFSTIPIVYFTSFFVTKETALSGLFRIIGLHTPFLVVIPLLVSIHRPQAINTVNMILQFSPHFVLSNTLVMSFIEANLGFPLEIAYHPSFIAPIGLGFFFFILVILIDTIESDIGYKSLLCKFFRRSRKVESNNVDVDVDVNYEREILQEAKRIRDHSTLAEAPPKETPEGEHLITTSQTHARDVEAQQSNSQEPLIVLEGLTKEYMGLFTKLGCLKEKKLAVDDLWFSVPSKQCFGFLGVNGSGKTTTIQMLTGSLIPTCGTARFGGVDLMEVNKKKPSLGLCPQFDALFEGLTGREHLYFYARVAGVSECVLPIFTDSIIKALGIQSYADRRVDHYSGGTRRKLALGLAFIRSPQIVFLDEPSSGVDPASRRQLWTVISETTRSGDRAVVLTTHMMEECEALCDRLTIMKDGRILCIGTPSRLKSRFGTSFTLDVTLSNPLLDMEESEENPENLVDSLITTSINSMTNLFPTAKLLEKVSLNIKWSIPKSSDLRLSKIFKIIEENKTSLSIESYVVSDASLESIFIQFQSE